MTSCSSRPSVGGSPKTRRGQTKAPDGQRAFHFIGDILEAGLRHQVGGGIPAVVPENDGCADEVIPSCLVKS